MSEVKIHRYDINLCPDRQCDCGASFATEECPDSNGDYVRYTDHQSELAALREELATTKNGYKWESERAAMLLEALNNCEADMAQHSSFESLYNAAIDERDAIQQRLADAERRNAELIGILEQARDCIDQMLPGFHLIAHIDAALTKPEEAKS